ncbi:MAG: ADP-glyceromanno-heptose 6-epimerase, partial [Alphaproteobacteria bacterium]|nr:ADP-glyceromanno-heptose 6-epimerase [Alphaproteobacteria bacterium]
LVAALAARGEEVAVVDRLGGDERWRNLAKHEIAALVAPEALGEYLDGLAAAPRAICHLGAISDTTERDVDRLVRHNVEPSLALWRYCQARQVPLLYASSAATYGDGRAGFDDDFTSAALARLRPLNAYAWSKHVVDRRFARLLARGEAPPQWVGLKFFNVFGANEYHKGEMRSVVCKAYEAVSRGQPVRLFRSHRNDIADGGQARDFVYVDDCIAAMLWFLDHPGVSGMFNLGSGRARSFADLAAALFAALGRPTDIEFVDTPVELRARYQFFTEAPLARLRAAGYESPFQPLEAAVDDYVERYLAAQDPYR